MDDRCGTGGTIRDCEGNITMCFSGSGGMKSVLFQELKAILQGLYGCQSINILKVEKTLVFSKPLAQISHRRVIFDNACLADPLLTRASIQISVLHSFVKGVSKGLVAERLLKTMLDKGMLPDFVLCVGDDRSDEDMFEAITTAAAGPVLSPVAKYYLVDTMEIVRMLQGLVTASEQAARTAPISR
ncbi:hypothetical protein IFM89_015235 [Coptis chinensis]|uniref:RNase H type-1 domain-containing protein n=1 Tax=Coptis chinensis TaxID=261450 RepID=A0A835LMB7_9MAGN|nr:hypothetical protein IFM89_015235 [Coptis chinensis]